MPAVLAIIAAQSWFDAGTVIGTGDLSPPVPVNTDYLSHWNQLASGEGQPSFDITWLPYLEALRIGDALGISPETIQRLWLTLLFAGAAGSVVYLGFALTGSAAAAGVAGVLASFNAYRLVTVPDHVPLVATIVAALLGGLVIRAGATGFSVGRGIVAFGLVSLGIGFVFTNPPHVALVLLFVAASLLLAGLRHGRTGVRRAGSFIGKAAPVAILANLWWLVPSLLTLIGSGSPSQLAAGGVDAWAWTHRRASLLNALTLNTTWAWEYPEYFPQAAKLNRFPFVVLKFALPVLALLGVLLVRPPIRRVALGLAAVALAGIWIAQGLQPPLGEVNRFLYDNVPGYWLFRDPAKALLLPMLGMSLLGGIAVARLAQLPRRLPSLGVVGAAVLMIGAFVYVHPLYSGTVIPENRPYLPSAHVRVPAMWSDFAGYLNARDPRGKLLVLPVGDFYQVPTKWGYYGVPFTRLMLRRPVFEQPSGYFSAQTAARYLATSVQRDVLNGRDDAVETKLHALGVRYVLLRGDVDPSFPGRVVADPERVGEALDQIDELAPLRSFDSLRLYEVTGGPSEVSAAVPIPYAKGDPGALEALPILPTHTAMVESNLPQISAADGRRVTILSSVGSQADIFRVERERVWSLTGSFAGQGFVLELNDPLQIQVDGQALPPLELPDLTFGRARPPFALTAGTGTFFIDGRSVTPSELGLIRSPLVGRVQSFRGERTVPVAPEAFGPVRDCNRYDQRTAEEVGLRSSIQQEGGVRALELEAQDHSACVSLPVTPFDPAALYRVQLEYRGLAGAAPRACLWLEGPNRCASLPPLEQTSDWSRYEATLRPPTGTQGLRLFLYADGLGTETTTVQFRRVNPAVYTPDEIQLISPVDSAISQLDLDSQEVPIQVDAPFGDPGTLAPEAFGPVRDCNRYDQRTAEEVGLGSSIQQEGGVRALELEAQDHSACVSLPITPFDPAALYRVQLEYRGLEGATPRACLWFEGPNRCASLPPLEQTSDWNRYEATLRPPNGTQGLRLFLYADGLGTETTTVQYRRVNLVASAPLHLAMLTPPRSDPLPEVKYERLGPAEFLAAVKNVDGPFLLNLTESYGPEWELQALGEQPTRASHVRVNGYANGWLIEGEGDYLVRLFYSPEELASIVRGFSLGIVILLVVLAAGWGRSRRRGAHSEQRVS